MIEGYRIVDVHCHPIDDDLERSKFNAYGSPNCTKDFFADMRAEGVDFCVGSVIRVESEPESFAPFAETNASGFELEKKYPDFYQTGIRINPLFVKDSIAELEKYRKIVEDALNEVSLVKPEDMPAPEEIAEAKRRKAAKKTQKSYKE